MKNRIRGLIKLIRIYRVRWVILPASFFLFLPFELYAQGLVDFQFQSYGLHDEEQNVIHNADHLNDFFESLYQQKTKNDRKISIIHIGDSHVQGDYLTSLIRRNFQHAFGNAGRGLVVPAKLAGTNNAFNIIIRSDVSWQYKRCVNPEVQLPIGIGGITIRNDSPSARLELYVNDLWMDYSFKEISLFHLQQNSFAFALKDSAGTEIGSLKPENSGTLNVTTALFDKPVSAIVLESIKANDQQNHATIFGINLANGENGIMYHAIGVNGARYTHFNAAAHFVEQTSLLDPALFIIALGTNEAIAYPYMDKNFYQQIDKLVTSLKTENPNARFILVTLPDSFRNKTKVNPGVDMVRQQILQYAVENGIAFYDMYKATGGEGSASEWRKANLLRKDGVHFTKEGYAYQGNLLFHAIIKSYNRYVPVRHP